MPFFFVMILENMGNISRWKESLVERTISRKNANLMQLVYGKSTSRPATTSVDEENGGDEESDGDDFFKIKGEGNKVCSLHYSFKSISF